MWRDVSGTVGGGGSNGRWTVVSSDTGQNKLLTHTYKNSRHVYNMQKIYISTNKVKPFTKAFRYTNNRTDLQKLTHKTANRYDKSPLLT